MDKSVKLNPQIRALFKSKAKEHLDLRHRSKSDIAQDALDEFNAEVKKDKAFAALDKRRTALREELATIESKIDKLGFGGYCDALSTGHPRYDESIRLSRELTRARECHCERGDSPKLLEFVAQLSLCKTVGEADALLAKLN